MIRVSITNKTITELNSQCIGLFFEQNFDFDDRFKAIELMMVPGLRQLLSSANFSGKTGEKLVVPVIGNTGVINLIFVGLGPKKVEYLHIEQFRRALGIVVKELARLKHDMLAIVLPQESMFNVTQEYLIEQSITIADMAYYHFDDFITDSSRKYPKELILTIVGNSLDSKKLEKAVTYGSICGHAVNAARYWVDLPPDHSTPADMAHRAQEIANAHGFACTVFNEQEVNQMGMGGLSAVSRGSERDCYLVALEYKAQNSQAPTIGIVGKGITFDSGGLSIKPADYMETMKDDMAGAAAVINVMDAIGSLKPNINVVAVVPLAENLPSGKAIKPGDIVTFYNGKTAEILNTDAEGRLILADALAYAVKHYKLDALVDLATLTGACSIALGHFYSALLSTDDHLIERIFKASQLSGDQIWRLPLTDEYKPAIRSENADIKNIGSKRYSAGTITAACFLENFVSDVSWAHLDIAGTAFDVPDISYYRCGATGAGVRLLIELIMNWPADQRR